MATALTSLDAVKEWLQITNDNSDDLLSRMITTFSDAVANEIGRDIGQQTYNIVRDGNGASTMVFVNYPTTSVLSLKINGVTIPPRAAFGQAGYVFTPNRITLVGYVFTKGAQNVELETVAGYATIPAELEQAVIEWIADRYASRDRVSITSKSLAGETISFAQNDIPEPVMAILRPYRKVVPN